MKARILFGMLVLALLTLTVVSAGGGFDEIGFNNQARMFKGWIGHYLGYEATLNFWIILKWSQDPPEVGSWRTEHYTWYSDFDYLDDLDNLAENVYNSWVPPQVLPWDDKDNPPIALYRLEQLTKKRWRPGYNPPYIQDVVEIFVASSTTLLGEYDLDYRPVNEPHKGLGRPLFV